MRIKTVLGLLVASAAPLASGASLQGNVPGQTSALPAYVNLDRATVLGRGMSDAQVGFRAFGGGESLTYATGAYRYGIGSGIEVAIRAAGADRRTVGVFGGGEGGDTDRLRTGGSDVELQAKYGFRNLDLPFSLSGQVGVAFPSTPGQNGDAHLTFGASADYLVANRLSFTLNPKVVLIRDNSLIGIGLGASYDLSAGFSVVGDYTPIVSGDNTRGAASYDRKRRDIYGIALRYAVPRSTVSVAAGFTDGLGPTTGFSLTPALAGVGGFYFAAGVRF